MKHIGLGALVFILSATIFPFLRIGGILFSAGIVLAVVSTLLGGLRRGMLATLTYAVMQDMFLSRLLGINLTVYIMIVWMLHRISREMYEESMTLPALMLFQATLHYHLVYFLIMKVFGLAIPFAAFLRITALELAYNILAGGLVYVIAFRLVKGYKPGSKNV